MMLGSAADSELTSLTECEIIFEDLQPMRPRFLNVTDGRTDRQTDGRLAVAIPRST